MSQETPRHPIAMKKVVYQMPGMDSIVVRRNEPFLLTGAGALTMDRYLPHAAAPGVRLPVVVIVLGFPPKEPNPLGCQPKEMEWSVSWGQLIAASGMMAIFYTNRDPEADLQGLLQHIRQHEDLLGIDACRIGLLATSGNAPVALAALMREGDRLKCAVLCWPYTMDLDDATVVAEAAEKWGFVNAPAGKTVNDLPRNVPLFVARAGKDEFPRLNETMDRFLVVSLACNLPLTLVNHSEAPHAFDLLHDSAATREIIRQILAFLRFHLEA
jgi:hypothetical protein